MIINLIEVLPQANSRMPKFKKQLTVKVSGEATYTQILHLVFLGARSAPKNTKSRWSEVQVQDLSYMET